jgi:hypothetical protein
MVLTPRRMTLVGRAISIAYVFYEAPMLAAKEERFAADAANPMFLVCKVLNKRCEQPAQKSSEHRKR